MRVTILDLDWYYKESSTINPICQKLSSYYKQLGSIVNFPTNDIELSLVYDLIYVTREKTALSVPSRIALKDGRVKLIGESFRFHQQYLQDIPGVIKACRPDYLLVESANKEIREQNILQFFDKNKLLSTQNYRKKTTRAVDNLIVDQNFWDKSLKDLVKIHDTLKKDKNIVYKYENKTSFFKEKDKIELFSKLHHKYYEPFNLVCDTDVELAIEIMEAFKKNSPNNKKPTLLFKPLLPENESQLLEEYHRILRSFYLLKAKEIRYSLIAPERNLTYYWAFFEDLEAWCKYALKTSYIEHMVCFELMEGYKLEDVLHSKKWLSYRADRLKLLLALIPATISQYGYLEWGKRSYYKKINFERIFN